MLRYENCWIFLFSPQYESFKLPNIIVHSSDEVHDEDLIQYM